MTTAICITSRNHAAIFFMSSKKLINAKGANIERVRNKYISSIYSHILMVYTTMYGYYSREDIEIDEYVRKDIQDTLNDAVEFSFQYYANFLLTYEDFSD